jgi:hypothetical protein
MTLTYEGQELPARAPLHRFVTLQGRHVLGHDGGVRARVYVPHTTIHPALKQVLDAPCFINGLTLGWTGVEMTEPDSYPNYLAERWAEGGPFINHEHDVLPWPGAYRSLWNCPHDWCVFGYGDNEVFTGAAYLGLVKFSARFVLETPGLWEPEMWTKMDQTPVPGAPFWAQETPRTWQHCDGHLAKYAQVNHISFHQHFPSVNHLH